MILKMMVRIAYRLNGMVLKNKENPSIAQSSGRRDPTAAAPA